MKLISATAVEEANSIHPSLFNRTIFFQLNKDVFKIKTSASFFAFRLVLIATP